MISNGISKSSILSKSFLTMNRFRLWARLVIFPALGIFLSMSAKRRYNKERHKIRLFCMKVQKFPLRLSYEEINTFTVKKY
jgi:hypothetical protein